MVRIVRFLDTTSPDDIQNLDLIRPLPYPVPEVLDASQDLPEMGQKGVSLADGEIPTSHSGVRPVGALAPQEGFQPLVTFGSGHFQRGPAILALRRQ